MKNNGKVKSIHLILLLCLSINGLGTSDYQLNGVTPVCWLNEDTINEFTCPTAIKMSLINPSLYKETPCITPVPVIYTVYFPSTFTYGGISYTPIKATTSGALATAPDGSDIWYANLHACASGLTCSPFILPGTGVITTTVYLSGNLDADRQKTFEQQIIFPDEGNFTLLSHIKFIASFSNGSFNSVAKWDIAVAVAAVVSTKYKWMGGSESAGSHHSTKLLLIASIGTCIIVIAVGIASYFMYSRYKRKKSGVGSSWWSNREQGDSDMIPMAQEARDYDGSVSSSYWRTVSPAPLRFSSTQNDQSYRSDNARAHKFFTDNFLHMNENLKIVCIESSKIDLIQSVGSGSYGEVVKAEYSGAFVAIKAIHRNHDEDYEAFYNEIKLMMSLRHPCIVQLVGISSLPRYGMVSVCEYMENGDLMHFLSGRSLEDITWEKYKLSIARDTALALGYLHGLLPPVIHRDLKSRNILIGRNFNAKVTDFGLSRTISSSMTMTIIGSNLWLAPEMIRGERFSEKIDVFSFGIVLSELDTHKLPYHDRANAYGQKIHTVALTHQVAHLKLRPSLSKNCFPGIRKLFEWCTQEDPNERPSALALIEALHDPNIFVV